MSTEQYFFLLDKKRREGLTPDEQQQLDAWLEASETNRALAADILALLKATEPAVPQVDVPTELAAFKQRLHREITVAAPVRRPIRWMWAAAAVFAALFAAFWFLRPTEPPETWREVATVLENNRRVDLPDGTVVWLNHHSKLAYRTAFNDYKQRLVRLEGEAYFEVQKNTGKRFVVEAPGVTTTVLGTVFNVNARQGAAESRVTVTEGRVRVEGGGGSEELTAGMQAVVSNEMGAFTVTTADPTAVADWRKPGLTFKNESLGAVVLQLSDRFGRQVRLDATAPADCRYTARFPQADLDAVLANLSAVFGVQVDTSDPGVIRLRGGQCTNE